MEEVKKMQSKEQLMMVATNCSEYDPIVEGFSASVGGQYSISCESCHHWGNNKCQIDIYDDVLSSIDQG